MKNLKHLRLSLTGLIALLGISINVSAAIIPYGVHNDVTYDQVTNDWGWSLCYRGNYNDTGVAIDTVFGNCNGDYLMLASMQDNLSTLDVLAAALKTDVLAYTPQNTTTTANGAEWYYNGRSLGFAGLGDQINQRSADTGGSTWDGAAVNENDRLSWHTSGGYAGTPTAVNGGWRSGENIELNYASNWDRLVFTANATSVPEPASLALMALGLAGLGVARRKTG